MTRDLEKIAAMGAFGAGSRKCFRNFLLKPQLEGWRGERELVRVVGVGMVDW